MTSCSSKWLCFGLFAFVCGPAAHADPPALRLERVDVARQAIEQIPDAIGLLRQGDYHRAESAFSQLLTAFPDVAHASTAAKLLGLPNPRAYRRLISSLHNNLGLSRFRARKYSLAENDYLEAIRSDPAAASPHENLGVLLLTRRDFPRAVRSLEAARARVALDSRGLLHLGRAYLGTGDTHHARWALQQSLRNNQQRHTPSAWGTRLEATRALARVDVHEGRLENARSALESVLALAPGDCESRYVLIQVLARQGQLESALTQQEQLDGCRTLMAGIQNTLAATPGRVDAIRLIGDAYRNLGLYHLAAVRYEQLLARNPTDKHARLALATLAQRVSTNSPQRANNQGNPP